MNKTLLKELKKATNYTYTENGGLTHKSTLNKCYDLFAFGGASRGKGEEDILDMFYDALREDKLLAMKLLFYIRDVRGGLGERRTFRIILKSLANSHPYLIEKNIDLISFYGRYDDLLVLFDTKCEDKMINLIAKTLIDDCRTNQPTLLAKWLPSENASSSDSRRLARKLAKKLSLTNREYRKTLSSIRNKIKIVENLLSEKKYNKIEFDKLPSKAGLKYRDAFLRHEELCARYVEFIDNKNSKINAKTLYPYDIIRNVWNCETHERKVLDKYWKNLPDYFDGKPCSILPVIDNSGSMTWNLNGGVIPIDVAVSLGIYCAERNLGDFHNHYISFSRTPKLVEIKGNNIVEKTLSAVKNVLYENTNIEAVFDLILKTLKKSDLSEECLPKHIVIISDMEFDEGTRCNDSVTLMERIRKEWAKEGYTMPNLVYWNVCSRRNNISDLGADNITYVSGCTPMIFKSIMSGKNGMDLMLDTLNSDRYSSIRV
jgi:hypothetical protein